MFKSVFLLLLAITTTEGAWAAAERCQEDMIADPAHGQGRNAWARKCGYMDAEEEAFNNRKGYYMVFPNANAPVTEAAECIAGLAHKGACVVGCMHPAEKILLPQGEKAIATAAKDQESQVMALSSDSDLQNISLVSVEIENFTKGVTRKPLYRLEVETGQNVYVTYNHPMVFSDGQIVAAEKIKVGEELLTVDGPREVINVQKVPYEGEVWNIRPKSEERRDNIHVVNGLLTGSIRFQNQWANDSWRLFRRLKDDINGL